MIRGVSNLLPLEMKTTVAYTDRKLSTYSNVNNKSKFSHQHDLVFFYHAKNLQVAHIIQLWKNKKYNKTNTNKTQNLLKVIFRF